MNLEIYQRYIQCLFLHLCEFQDNARIKRAWKSWSKSKEVVVDPRDARTEFVWESIEVVVTSTNSNGSA